MSNKPALHMFKGLLPLPHLIISSNSVSKRGASLQHLYREHQRTDSPSLTIKGLSPTGKLN